MSISLSELPDVLTPKEFAAAVRKGKNYPFDEIRAGRLRCVRLSPRAIRIPKSEVLRYLGLDKHKGGPDAAVAD